MITQASSPSLAAANLNWGPSGFEDCGSVCQLQLMRLVHQSTAAAGWLAYHPTPHQRQVVEAVATGASLADVPDGQALTAAPFVDRLLQQATEVQRDVWAFCHRPLAQPQAMIYGLRFRDHRNAEWADLVLWQTQPLAPVLPQTGLRWALGFDSRQNWPATPVSSGLSEHPDDPWLAPGLAIPRPESCPSPRPSSRPDPDAQLGPDQAGPHPNGAAGEWWPSLPAEVAALQTAMRLDQTHTQQQQQIHHYQNILRRLEHQLRHPLAMIHLYAANLHNSLLQASDRHQAQTIREAVGHLSDQLTELIAGCQRSQVQTEVCSVPDLWAEAWQGLRLTAQAKQVELRLPNQPLTLAGDRAQLLQAFTNLLHNALYFSPPKSQISAQWQAFQREVVITLTDQGPGLSPTDFQQMFRPYYSNRPQGSGLGLTIARQIVQQHGGKLWADNLPQGGAQFSLVLPLSPP